MKYFHFCEFPVVLFFFFFFPYVVKPQPDKTAFSSLSDPGISNHGVQNEGECSR